MTNSPLNLEHLRVGVIRFPGSNCDRDAHDVLTRHFRTQASYVWHSEKSLKAFDAIVVPGGFSFGDYLRSGALASHAPVMGELADFAAKGKPVIGICNGFQILVEARILPGVLLRNNHRQFICKKVLIKKPGPMERPLSMPVAHGEGRYYADPLTLNKLQADGLIAYQYCDDRGEVLDVQNPNGSELNIAGIWSQNKKVLGMMPHPERATDLVAGGSEDGLHVWRDFFSRV